MKKFLERSKGFTLVELMVVIAIIGILAVVALGIVRGAQQRAKDAALQATTSNLSTALEAYYAAGPSGQYPADLDDLVGVVLDIKPPLPSGCEYELANSANCGISFVQEDGGEGYIMSIDYVDDTKNNEVKGGTSAYSNN